jgi:Tfp pilus assembly protein PilX
MMRKFSRLHREESGIAMVVAMMVVFVVVLLSIVILDLSIHNVDQAAYDRKRVTSVAASEAGIDQAWNLVQYTKPQNLPCASPDTSTLGSAPGPAQYTASYVWYGSTGSTLTCPLSQTNVPSAVLVTSTGTTNQGVPRTMQAYMTLQPTFGGFDAAVIAVQNTTFNNNFAITGSAGNNGDIYITNGNLTVTNTPNIYGNVYVPNGLVTMTNNNKIIGNLWANGSISINSPASVTGKAISSTSSISGTGSVGGDATAGTTIASGLTVGGTRYANSPQGPPPTQVFPLLCQVAIAGVCNALPWTGYTLHTYTDCTAPRTFLRTGTLTGDHVLWINAVCNLNIQNNDVINFTGNLAIVTQGSVTMTNQNNWNGAVGKNLYFISNYRTGLTCSSGSYNIATGSNSNFANAHVLFYSPCTVTLNNQNDFTGQVIGDSVVINNHFTLNATQVKVEGAGDIVGFQQSIVYIREVRS